MVASPDDRESAGDSSARRYEYRPEILERLLAHGVRPHSTTPPALVREFIEDLYRHELRRLRSRVRRRELRHSDLTSHVLALRRRYPLVSIPIEEWTMPVTSPHESDPSAR
jgi:hypothetical protein